MKIKKGVSRPGQWGWELELAGRAAFVPAILLGRAVPQARVAGGQRLMPCSGRAKTASHGPGLGLHGQLYQYPYIQIHNFREAGGGTPVWAAFHFHAWRGLGVDPPNHVLPNEPARIWEMLTNQHASIRSRAAGASKAIDMMPSKNSLFPLTHFCLDHPGRHPDGPPL